MIPFNKPFLTGNESDYITTAHDNGILSGDGPFTKFCQQWIERKTDTHKSLLTHSCTAALEMAALLLDIQPGDEVIMPSYTFVSTANAFVLRGGVPVFVDIREDTLNINEKLIEAAITPKTRAIVPVHYAGVACEMDTIMETAHRHGLAVIEDAAQGVMSTYKGRALGSIGDMGCFSFHETKNVISGEGGALLINNPKYAERAEIIREKGTNRTQFFRGQVDKYTWVDVGSSYLPGEIIAAFLWAQLQQAEYITNNRMEVWATYHEAFADLESQGILQRPSLPEHCQHNAHMYFLIMKSLEERTGFITFMRAQGIHCVFHYVPLHSAPYGLQAGRTQGDLLITSDLSERLVRMPLWIGMGAQQERVIKEAIKFFKS